MKAESESRALSEVNSIVPVDRDALAVIVAV